MPRARCQAGSEIAVPRRAGAASRPGPAGQGGLALRHAELREEQARRPGRDGIVDALEQRVHRRAGDPLLPGIHGRQRRDRVPRLVEVVEPDDGDILRHAPAGLLQGAHGPERERVVEAEDRVEIGAPVEEFAHASRAVRAMPERRVADDRLVVRHARGLERLPVAAQSQPGRPDHLALVRADDGDAPPPGTQQELGRRPRRLDVLHRDVVGGPVEDPLAEHHQRVRHVEAVDVVLPHAERAEDEPVGHLQPRAAQELELAVAVAAGLLHEHHDAGLLSGLDDGCRELGEVAQPEFGHRERDRPGAAGPQAPGREVRGVPELGDRALDPFPRGGPDVRVVVDDVRHGLDRHAREPCDIVQRRRHV